MAKVIMGIGTPGAGKTTALKPFAQENGYTYICPDDIRTELTGDPGDQTKNAEVWDEARRRVRAALEEGETIVFDATFAKEFERKDFIHFARESGAEKVQGVFVDVPLEIAHDRNSERERVVPPHALERMHRFLTDAPPELSDGFDTIFYLDETQQLIKAEMQNDEYRMSREFKKFH